MSVLMGVDVIGLTTYSGSFSKSQCADFPIILKFESMSVTSVFLCVFSKVSTAIARLDIHKCPRHIRQSPYWHLQCYYFSTRHFPSRYSNIPKYTISKHSTPAPDYDSYSMSSQRFSKVLYSQEFPSIPNIFLISNGRFSRLFSNFKRNIFGQRPTFQFNWIPPTVDFPK